jgi:hypothetical protein
MSISIRPPGITLTLLSAAATIMTAEKNKTPHGNHAAQQAPHINSSLDKGLARPKP